MSARKPASLSWGGQGNLNGTNYADVAQRIMSQREERFPGLTTTKLRKIYGLIANIYTRIDSPDSFEANRSDLQYLKAKMAYEAGREKPVKAFLDATGLMGLISVVKTYDQFVLYCRYAESLVAYFKFYGGRDRD